MNKIGIKSILKRKNKEKIAVLTCYDYSFAKILDETDIDMLLVGDSLANVVLGLDETRDVSLEEMLNHTAAVSRAVRRALVIADMPYAAYQKDPKKCVYYANKFIEAGADAVKVEWFDKCRYVTKRLIKNKIAVMGHIGLTPQTVHLLGGYKVQGKDEVRASELIQQAKILEDLGVFSIVLECIPYQLARKITKKVRVPTIGIGAGKYCDGQVLVLYDVLGLYKKVKPKFVKVYEDISLRVKSASLKFSREVKKGKFPTKKESFSSKIS